MMRYIIPIILIAISLFMVSIHEIKIVERPATQEEIETLPPCSGVVSEHGEPYELTIIAPNGKEYKMMVANATTTYSFPCIQEANQKES